MRAPESWRLAGCPRCLRVFEGAFESTWGRGDFDAVSMIQVIAHFQRPHAALEKAREHLRGGGLLLIETWDRDSLAARLFRKAWHECSSPSVLHFFSKSGLRRLVEQEGFAFVTEGRPARSIRLSHAHSLLEYRLRNWSLGRALAGSLKLLPANADVRYPGDDLFWVLMRKA